MTGKDSVVCHCTLWKEKLWSSSTYINPHRLHPVSMYSLDSILKLFIKTSPFICSIWSFFTLMHITWCLTMIVVSLQASSWSSILSRYTTGWDIQLFCRYTKCEAKKNYWTEIGFCQCLFVSPYDTWISALSTAPNISTFLSVLDGFWRSNLRLLEKMIKTGQH